MLTIQDTDAEFIARETITNIMGDMRKELHYFKELSAQLIRENRRLSEFVFVDELTGLFNFRYLKMRLDEELTRSSRHGRDFALIAIDLDNLKKINDNFGHQTGNKVIKQLSLS